MPFLLLLFLLVSLRVIVVPYCLIPGSRGKRADGHQPVAQHGPDVQAQRHGRPRAGSPGKEKIKTANNDSCVSKNVLFGKERCSRKNISWRKTFSWEKTISGKEESVPRGKEGSLEKNVTCWVIKLERMFSGNEHFLEKNVP